ERERKGVFLENGVGRQQNEEREDKRSNPAAQGCLQATRSSSGNCGRHIVGSAPSYREKTAGAHSQHDGHKDVNHHGSDGGAGNIGAAAFHDVAQQGREQSAPKSVDHTYNQRRIEGAAYGADTADDDHHHGQDENGFSHADL